MYPCTVLTFKTAAFFVVFFLRIFRERLPTIGKAVPAFNVG